MMRLIKRLVVALIGTGSLGLGQVQANQVLNPGFETGDFSNYTVVKATNESSLNVSDVFPHSGKYDAAFGAFIEGDPDTIYQDISTVAGSKYDFSFYLANLGTDHQNVFTASFGGLPVLTLTNAASFNYTLFDYSVVSASTTTRISFSASNPTAYFLLDDINVSPSDTTATPEPSTLILTACGIPALLLVGYRKRRRRVAA